MKSNFLILLYTVLFFFTTSTQTFSNEIFQTEILDSFYEEAPFSHNMLDLEGESAILIDANTSEILYEYNAYQIMYPASTTKLMTALLAIENASLSEQFVFSQTAINAITSDSAQIAMQPDEEMTIEQALYALFLRSANEVCNGIAEYIGGSMENFAFMMTEKAIELGCLNTNFVNANGLFDENHYTTAYDLALIGKEVLKYDSLRAIMGEVYYEIPPTNKQVESRYLHGQHQMQKTDSVYYYDSVIGGKNGYVSQSANTLVTFAKEGQMELIAVVLKCSGTHYKDTTKLLDYGFDNFQTIRILEDTYTHSVDVFQPNDADNTILDTVTFYPYQNTHITLANDILPSDIIMLKNIPTLYAPITEGDVVGSLDLSTIYGDFLTSIPFYADKTIIPNEEIPFSVTAFFPSIPSLEAVSDFIPTSFFSNPTAFFTENLFSVIEILAIIFVIGILILILDSYRTNKKNKERLAHRKSLRQK